MATLTRQRICDEALALVDEEGLEALSMRRLGARLGVEAMSLYNHVKHKRDLLDALHAAVLGGLKPPAGADGDWRKLLHGLATALRAALVAHPNVAVLFATRPLTAPEALEVVARAFFALERAGFRAADAHKAIVAVGVYTVGHTIGEINAAPQPELGQPEGPTIAEFRFGLDALLDGLTKHEGKRKS